MIPCWSHHYSECSSLSHPYPIT